MFILSDLGLHIFTQAKPFSVRFYKRRYQYQYKTSPLFMFLVQNCSSLYSTVVEERLGMIIVGVSPPTINIVRCLLVLVDGRGAKNDPPIPSWFKQITTSGRM